MKVCPTCDLKYPDENERCFVDHSELQPMPDTRIGTVLKGRYQIEEPLGEGGMATVYRARNTLVERPVAVKVMNSNLARDEGLKERFRREAKNAAAVAHPNIIEIFDYGETDDGTPFLVMEILDGEPLNRIVERGPMSAGQVATIGVQVARGLARAHDFDVLHRDLKPENIFVCRSVAGRAPVAKLLDFGIARSMHDSRLTNAGEIFGTPQYMAPERVTSLDAGPSADLYALGAILFEMVTGRLPFEANDIPGFLIRHMQEPPPLPSQWVPEVPRRMEELILQLLEKKPEDRPVDAHAVVKVLESMVPQGIQVSLPAPSSGDSQRPPAPTLPPTTLERWAQRARLFEQMLARAFPKGEAPLSQVQILTEIKGILARVHALRTAGLKAQRELEELESRAREGRERLGHAVHVLAEDLSNAREAARSSQKEAPPRSDAESAAEQAYVRSHEALLALGGGAILREPTEAVVRAARAMAEKLEEWHLARRAARKARGGDARGREVADLEFQVDALRGQLERLETEYEQERSTAEENLRSHGEEIERLEKRLTELGSRFVEPLRTRRVLVDLFARLEGEGSPPAPGS